MTDEPFLETQESRGPSEEAPSIEDRIGRLVREQPYAILCTQGEGQPYGSLVAIATTDDLASMVFATPRATRKYRLLMECDHVAVVIDSRSRKCHDMMEIEACTVTGRVTELVDADELSRFSELLLARHSQLKEFLASPSTALFRVDVVRYFHVSRFQEVRQWAPPSGSSR